MSRSTEDIRRELATERKQLTDAVEQLRHELGVAAKRASTGLVLASGLRYLARRRRGR
jgi:hypothetical protein